MDRVCRDCGCTDWTACYDQRSELLSCWWVEDDLCSACDVEGAA